MSNTQHPGTAFNTAVRAIYAAYPFDEKHYPVKAKLNETVQIAFAVSHTLKHILKTFLRKK